MTVGEIVKQALINKRISQVELSQRTNLSTSQISRIINNERGASIDSLVLIADVLGINRDSILRAAAGLPTNESTNDTWIKSMNQKLNLVPNDTRLIAEKLLDALIAEPKPAPTKKAKSKA